MGERTDHLEARNRGCKVTPAVCWGLCEPAGRSSGSKHRFPSTCPLKEVENIKMADTPIMCYMGVLNRLTSLISLTCLSLQ